MSRLEDKLGELGTRVWEALEELVQVLLCEAEELGARVRLVRQVGGHLLA